MVNYRDERGKLYAQTGNQQLALADLDRAITSRRGYANASEPKFAAVADLERAKLRDRSGDREGAKLDRQQAAAINAKNIQLAAKTSNQITLAAAGVYKN